MQCLIRTRAEGGGGGGKDLLINFNTADSHFDFHWLKYHPDHCPGGGGLNSYTNSRDPLALLK